MATYNTQQKKELMDFLKKHPERSYTIDEIAAEMKAGINPAKWICVEADDLQVVACGDVVLLIMVSSQLSVTSQDIVDAFREVCGGTLTVE